MKIKLLTDFVCIATSGRTADGREISAHHLKEMAESYNKSTYTAQIWLEHYRMSGSFGQVEELKAEDVGGKTKLYARLAPNDKMIALNKQDVGLFTSIEITEPFSDTGKAYLTGLAITDSPSSLGTTQLMFSRIGQKDVIVGNNEPLVFNLQAQPESENDEETKQKARNGFFNWLFGTKADKETEQRFNAQSEEADKGSEEMTEEQIKAIAVAAAQTVLSAQNQPDKFSEEEKTEEVETVTVPKADYEALVAKVNAVEESVKAVEEKFNLAMTNSNTQVPHGANGIAQGAENHFKITTAI